MNSTYVIMIVLISTILVTFILVHMTQTNAMFKESNVEYEHEIPTEELFINMDGESVDEGDGIHIMRFHIKDNGPIILHCHGNNANLTTRQYMIDLCKIFNVNLILFDYHGFGRSNGSVSSKYLRPDALAAYKYTTSIYDAKRIIIWGESLGATMAAWLASQYKCNKLIIVSGFSSIEDMILCSGISHFIVFPFAMITRISADTLPTKDMLKKVSVPTLIIHSTEDTVISYRNSIINFKKYGSTRKKMIKIKGDHSCPKFEADQVRDLLRFIEIRSELITIGKINEVVEVLNNVDMNAF